MRRLCGVEYGGDRGVYVRIWKEAVPVYLKVLSPRTSEEMRLEHISRIEAQSFIPATFCSVKLTE